MIGLAQWQYLTLTLIIGFVILMPASGYALKDAPSPWLRQLCGSGMQPGPAQLQSLAVVPDSAALEIDQRQNFEARGTFSDGSTQDLTAQASWTSSNTNVGAINNQGQFTAENAGTTTIEATVEGISGTANVTVRARPVQLDSLSVRPSSVTLDIGKRQNFEARGNFSDGSTKDLTDEARWTSSDEDVGSINNQGRFTAEKEGKTTIRASVDGKNDTATVTVRAPSNPSCREQFGSAPGFRLCEEKENTCSFNAFTDGGNCAEMCRSLGSRCVGAFDNEEETPCTPNPGTNDTCQTNRQTEICVCER